MGNTPGFVLPPGDPNTRKTTEVGESETLGIRYAVSGMKGLRNSMEDRHLTSLGIPLSHPREEQASTRSLLLGGCVDAAVGRNSVSSESTTGDDSSKKQQQQQEQQYELEDHSLFAVFDGHGGNFTSTYLQSKLISVLSRQPELLQYAELTKESRADVNGVVLLQRALERTFQQLDQELLPLQKKRNDELLKQQQQSGGATKVLTTTSQLDSSEDGSSKSLDHDDGRHDKTINDDDNSSSASSSSSSSHSTSSSVPISSLSASASRFPVTTTAMATMTTTAIAAAAAVAAAGVVSSVAAEHTPVLLSSPTSSSASTRATLSSLTTTTSKTRGGANAGSGDQSTSSYSPSSQASITIERSGSTAVVVLLTPTQIICANTGDSRAVLRRYGKAYPLSFDHKPSELPERLRIIAAGGTVKSKRVDGDLAVSRAFGDFMYKEGEINNNKGGGEGRGRAADEKRDDDEDGNDGRIVPTTTNIKDLNDCEDENRVPTDYDYDENGLRHLQQIYKKNRLQGDSNSKRKVIVDPDILTYPRDMVGDEFIVLACDGIWDVATNRQCCEFIQLLLSEGELDLGNICEEVLDTCLDRNSRDNMTMMVIGFPAMKADTSSAAVVNNALWGHRSARRARQMTVKTMDATIKTCTRLGSDLVGV